jgi:hypothetical protein
MSARLTACATMAIAMVIALDLAGCAAPTDVARETPRSDGRPSIDFEATLLVHSARQDSWLRAGDTVAARIRATPNDGAPAFGQVEGTMEYDGVPIWYAARSDSAAFRATYFTHAELGDRLISVFWRDNLSGARLVLIMDPQTLALQWVVTATEPTGELVEIASGTGGRGSRPI